jgi:hypothetical protein
VQKLDNEIEGVLEATHDEHFDASQLRTIRQLMRERASVLQPVHIRVSKLDKLDQRVVRCLIVI